MGDFKAREILNAADRSTMYAHALKDIEAFELMLQENMFESGRIKIGAEQELCIVDSDMNPALSALNILDSIDDPHYTNELALFNLEINLDPLPFSDRCFQNMESELLRLLKKGYTEAAKLNNHIVLTGILPTLKYRHLQFENMTPIKRYKTISQSLSRLRGSHFEVYLQGVDDFSMALGSVLFEACNTSFQTHLQIEPQKFVNAHNWAQMISGPVLSSAVNSPMLFGNELWSETRIALFKQSLDTRSPYKYLRKKLPRVYFGNDWLKKSAAGLWKNDLMRFPLIATSDDWEDAMLSLNQGKNPDLRAIRLHNGTTYTWNRMCYGFSGAKPHLRIECRYLPAGPSPIDEISNFAFWVGLMNAEPPEGITFWKNIDFREAKSNFTKAARYGLNTVFRWYGQNIPAKKLLLDHLIPMAKKGLIDAGVASIDIDKYLSVIEQRVSKETTGADWIVSNFRRHCKKSGNHSTQQAIVKHMSIYQKENIPVHEWDNIGTSSFVTHSDRNNVESIMSTDIFSVGKDDSIDLAKNILLWNNIHHLPVEDKNGDLCGLITDGILSRVVNKNIRDIKYAGDLMIKKPVTVHAFDPIASAKLTMKKNKLTCVPVVYNKKLVGILTNVDLDF